ncbi:MAG: hypothetical protein H7Y88_06450 [Phycisphaerales bacterium]|nr:hypothetical protein [Phycisphaerales bacterium]
MTIIEVLVVMVLLVILLAVFLLPAIGQPRHRGTRHLKDSTQVRGIVQAMVVWANSNQDRYPLPSVLDPENATTTEQGAAKDHTANILSILIFNGWISPEITINPAESNTAFIERDDDYQYTDPPATVRPADALWDPAFKADFSPGAPQKANNSYAHMMPSRARLEKQWRNTFSATEAFFGNRGPEVTGWTKGGKRPAFNDASNTLLIHGGRTSWEGNIGYNDSHVAFETTMSPEGMTYAAADGKPPRDILFYDEPDDLDGLNAFLGVYKSAGATPSEFRAIWD